MIEIAYIILIIVGLFCIGITIWEHKNLKQKNIDTELYNQNLQITKDYLEKENQRLVEEEKQKINSIKLIYEQFEDLQEDEKLLRNIINELTEQKQKIHTEVETESIIVDNLRKEQGVLMAQIGTLKQSIDQTMQNQQDLARQAFSSWADALDLDYNKKETEYDELIKLLYSSYDKNQEELIDRFNNIQEEYRANIEEIKVALDQIRATRAAAMEAQLREQEIKDQATFYTLQLNEADRRDVAYLQSIEYNLREARPLRMLIWSTFYRDKVNELAARVGAVGASGIYKITHIDSGISYIGQAKDIKERWVTHVKCSLGIDTPVTSQLYAFTRENGIDNFTFEILEKCNLAELNEKEKFYIDLYQTYDFGLNATKGNK